MTDDINVIVFRRSGRKYLYLKYTDPVTGQKVSKSAETSSKREAIKRAGEWQAELRASGDTRSQSLRWDDFREDFFTHCIDHRSVNYGHGVAGTFNVIERTMRPDKLNRVTTAWLKRFHTTARKSGVSAATIHKYFQHLKTALKWAVEQGYLKTLPAFPKMDRNAAKRKKHMKGRPVTLEEFERMQDACDHESIRHLVEGLWLSGLRLGEALNLTWNQWADGIRIQIDDNGDVFLLIDAEDQKNRDTTLYPVVDEFAAFLLQTPPEQRTGFVFNPQRARGSVSRRVDSVSKWIVEVGKKAGVKVDQRDTKPVFASAHDLRRAFGERWSKRVSPMILRDLMRHASVETTEKYYVGVNARNTLAELRRVTRSRHEVPLEVPQRDPRVTNGEQTQ